MQQQLFKNGIPYVQKDTLWTTIIEPEEDMLNHAFKNTWFEADANGFPSEDGIIQLSRCFHRYSDERFETGRFFTLKNERITEQINITAKIPNFTVIMPEPFMLEQIRLYCQKRNSTVLFAHNHPSGNIFPSDSDIKLTNYLNNFFVDDNRVKRFAGHLIIGKDYTAWFKPLEKQWMFVDEYSNDGQPIKPIEEFASIYKPASNNMPQIAGSLAPYVLGNFAHSVIKNAPWDTKGYVPAFYLNNNGYVQGIEFFDKERWYDTSQFVTAERIKESAIKSGTSSVIFYIPTEETITFDKISYIAQTTHTIKDVFMPQNNKFRTMSPQLSHNIFRPEPDMPLFILKTQTFDIDTSWEQHCNRTIKKNSNEIQW